MLKSLYAKNYVLLDELKIEFRAGLNIITGETGAGKSVLMGALGVLLGERTSKDVIRTGADKAIVEGEFNVGDRQNIRTFLQENDLEQDDCRLILRREINSSGKNRCFVNDTPVPVSVLDALGDILVDLHGQHEHQLLFQTARHGEYLDAFAGLAAGLSDLRMQFEELSAGIHALQELQNRAADLERMRDLNRFQLNEIAAVDPQADEDQQLENQEHILKNAELLYGRTLQLFQTLYESDGSVSETLAAAEADLSRLAEIDPRFIPQQADCQNARIVVDELAASLGRYNESISFDAEGLERIRTRLAVLAGLKKKYGGSLKAVLDLKAKLIGELELIENLDDNITDLKKHLEESRAQLAETSLRISRQRETAASDFAQKVMRVTSSLGMDKAKFKVANHQREQQQEPFVCSDGRCVRVTSKGIDHIEFIISANPGEDYKPLVSVASGGEISRIMLALKTLLAEADQVPVLVFDEIDLGISGRIAQAVGKSLRALAQTHQVICITHLPQIASMAHAHYLVEKVGDDISTRTVMHELSEQERVEQIAGLFGGETVTEASRQSALELIAEAGKI